jgi:hypothetical protein
MEIEEDADERIVLVQKKPQPAEASAPQHFEEEFPRQGIEGL